MSIAARQCALLMVAAQCDRGVEETARQGIRRSTQIVWIRRAGLYRVQESRSRYRRPSQSSPYDPRANADARTQVLDTALAFLIAFLVRDQRLAEPLLRVTAEAFSAGAQDEDAIFNEPTCDVLEILVALLGRSWSGEVIGAEAKGMSKADARVVSSTSTGLCASLMTFAQLTIVREIVDKSKLMDSGSLPVRRIAGLERSSTDVAHQITVKSISLVAISIIASFPPRSNIFLPQYRICTSGALDAVMAALVQETGGLDTRMQKYEAGMVSLLPCFRSQC